MDSVVGPDEVCEWYGLLYEGMEGDRHIFGFTKASVLLILGAGYRGDKVAILPADLHGFADKLESAYRALIPLASRLEAGDAACGWCHGAPCTCPKQETCDG